MMTGPDLLYIGALWTGSVWRHRAVRDRITEALSLCADQLWTGKICTQSARERRTAGTAEATTETMGDQRIIKTPESLDPNFTLMGRDPRAETTVAGVEVACR